MKPDLLQVFLSPSWLIPKLGGRKGRKVTELRFKSVERHFGGALPVTDLVSDGDAQVEARVLGDHAAPLATASSAQLRYTPDLFIPIGQRQVIPVDAANTTLLQTHTRHVSCSRVNVFPRELRRLDVCVISSPPIRTS